MAVNYREADITHRQKIMLGFAMKVSREPRSIDESDSEVLRDQGFSKEDIWDAAGINALHGLSNRMMNFAKFHPDEEFYMMGR